jgi:hypothetical protein
MLALGVFWVLSVLATLSLLLPILAARRRWPELSRAQRAFLAYLVLELVTELICFVLGREGRNNHWVTYALIPVETALLVATFARWQIDRTMRRLLWVAAPAMLLFWIPPLAGWENVTGFSLEIDSIQGIICLAIAAYTVVRRALDTTTDVVLHDWFFIGSGVMLYFATYALMDPLNRYLMAVSPDTILAVLTVRAGAQILANVLYYQGMRCPVNPQSSGRSSLPQPPWSLSSWSRSVRP